MYTDTHELHSTSLAEENLWLPVGVEFKRRERKNVFTCEHTRINKKIKVYIQIQTFYISAKHVFNNIIKITKTKIANSINGNVTKVPFSLDLFT